MKVEKKFSFERWELREASGGDCVIRSLLNNSHLPHATRPWFVLFYSNHDYIPFSFATTTTSLAVVYLQPSTFSNSILTGFSFFLLQELGLH